MPADPSTLSFGQKAKYYVSNLFLRGLIGGFGLIPYEKRIPAMGRLLAGLSPLMGFDKRVRANLALTCPDLSEEEVARLCNDVADNVGRTLMEFYAGEPFQKRGRAAKITGPGFEALKNAKQAGRPVILVTGHFGNYDAARVALMNAGFPLGALYRRMANPYFNDDYVRAIEGNGKPMFEQGKRGMVEMVRYLKKGGTIAIVTDLHVHGGTQIDFFGKPAVTSLVPAELALKFNAVVIPAYGIRQENGLDFEIRMSDEIPLSDAVTMTKAMCEDLEHEVRQRMGQWFWIHKRWKPFVDTKPAAE